MKSFFSDMNLARWIILMSLLASAGLGFYGWTLHEERIELEGALEASVPKQAQEIQVLSLRCSKLNDELLREGLKGQNNPEEYIRNLAINSNVQLGSVRIASSQGTPRKDVVDRKYKIEPQEAKAGHKRSRIANYMWLLEQQSRRVRVTNIRLDQKGKYEPWEPSDDLWEWEIEVTSRQNREDT
jgi:hypothetical protein